MTVLKNYQVTGPFKAGSIDNRANIAVGEVRETLAADYKLDSVNTSHTICHIGIQCDYTMPTRYIESFKRENDKNIYDKFQNKLQNYIEQKSINQGFEATKNAAVYLDNSDNKEIQYYFPRAYLDPNTNLVLNMDNSYGDICIKGTNYNLDVDAKPTTFKQYFNLNETGILEFDMINCYSLEIYFLKDMPAETIVDIVWNYKN